MKRKSADKTGARPLSRALDIWLYSYIIVASHPISNIVIVGLQEEIMAEALQKFLGFAVVMVIGAITIVWVLSKFGLVDPIEFPQGNRHAPPPPPPPIQRAGGVPTSIAQSPCKQGEDLVAAPPGMPTRAGVVCLPRRR